MKLVFVSNFYNHHQSFLSKKLFELTKGNYKFIETSKIPDERKILGYSSYKDKFVLNYEKEIQQAQQWIDEADVVIIGSSQKDVLANRKKQNKIIFKYSERPLKNGFEIWKYPIRWLRWHMNNPRNKPIYLLCASAYTASDYAKFGMYKGRAYKWGYFPNCKKYDDIEKVIKQKKQNEILWCGRFLDWKHPDDVLTVVKMLKDDGYDFHVSMIGMGEMEANLKENIINNNLQKYVSFLGTMTPELVRKYMENAGIYLLTSDRKEGWGAVLNEAMNSGCAVIGAKEAGAVPYMLKDGENGLVYESRKIRELYKKLTYLLNFKEEQLRFGKAAYQTIISEWNHEIAAKRLVEMCNAILNGETEFTTYKSGPCSRA